MAVSYGQFRLAQFREACHQSALRAAKKWARLHDFPTTATNVRVKVSGGLFTRTFTITFMAPLADIDRWLQTSPGTMGVTPEKNGLRRRYDIAPGGGAAYAEVEVDEEAGTVEIYTYWS